MSSRSLMFIGPRTVPLGTPVMTPAIRECNNYGLRGNFSNLSPNTVVKQFLHKDLMIY